MGLVWSTAHTRPNASFTAAYDPNRHNGSTYPHLPALMNRFFISFPSQETRSFSPLQNEKLKNQEKQEKNCRLANCNRNNFPVFEW